MCSKSQSHISGSHLTQFWNPGVDVDTLTEGDVAVVNAAETVRALNQAYVNVARVLSDEPHHCVQVRP